MRPGQRRRIAAQQDSDNRASGLRCEPAVVTAATPVADGSTAHTVLWRGAQLRMPSAVGAVPIGQVVVLLIPPQGVPFIAFRLTP